MSDKNRRRPEEEKARLKEPLKDANIASAINIAAGRGKRSVTSKQRIVQKNGMTTRISQTSTSETDE